MTSYNFQQELTSIREFLTSLDVQQIAFHQGDLDYVRQRLLEACRACSTQRNALAIISRLPPETLLHVFAQMEIKDLIHCVFFIVYVDLHIAGLILYPFSIGGMSSVA